MTILGHYPPFPPPPADGGVQAWGGSYLQKTIVRHLLAPLSRAWLFSPARNQLLESRPRTCTFLAPSEMWRLSALLSRQVQTSRTHAHRNAA